VAATGLVVGEIRGLVEALVGLLVVRAREVLGLVGHLTEVRHGIPSSVLGRWVILRT
jgi:hypothetical protein